MSATLLTLPCRCGNAIWHSFPTVGLIDGLSKVGRGLRIAFTDIIPSTIFYVIPARISWYLNRSIKHVATFKVMHEKTVVYAYLYFQNNTNNSDVHLFTHGIHSHPSTMTHFAKGRSFYLSIPTAHKDEEWKAHGTLLEKSIDKISEITKDGIKGIGHSKGAILLAERQFVHQDFRIKKVISIAGRLHVPNGDESAPKLMIPFINKISEAIKAPENRDRVLVQVVAKDDWRVPYAAAAVRPTSDCYTVPGGHLNVLYKKETRKIVNDQAP